MRMQVQCVTEAENVIYPVMRSISMKKEANGDECAAKQDDGHSFIKQMTRKRVTVELLFK